jgi:D-glycero-D-manno-heptose 1,7-bisphosphate phosphatase
VINVDHAMRTGRTRSNGCGHLRLCRAAIDAGFLPIVVTNQAGIARGFYDEAQFLAFTRWIHEEFARRGAPLLATYYCPTIRRRPGGLQGRLRLPQAGAGMFRAALREFDLDAASSWMVGDKPGDIEAARAAGVGHAILLAAGTDASGVAAPPSRDTRRGARDDRAHADAGRTPCGG